MIPAPEDIVSLVKKAGDAAQALRRATREVKQDGSDITEADRVSHRILTEGLEHFGFPVLSEEAASFPNPTEGPLWIIDPLDGTSDFIKGSPDWCVMVGMLAEGRPVMGVVYAPELGLVWSAAAGKGSFVRDAAGSRRLSVSAIAEPARARVLKSATHPSTRSDEVARRFGGRELVRGSMGVKLGLIAAGSAECYWREVLFGEWDVCAPQIILEEAGGTVTDGSGAPLRYGNPNRRLAGGFAASNGFLHEALIAAARFQ